MGKEGFAVGGLLIAAELIGMGPEGFDLVLSSGGLTQAALAVFTVFVVLGFLIQTRKEEETQC